MSDRTQPLTDDVSVADRTDALGEANNARTLPANGQRNANRGDDDEALVGRILAGRYQLDGVLGRGGMGVVYSARHIAINRAIAVKVLRRDLARSGDAVARFHREARAAASIGSPFIVDVFDFGFTDDGDAYIAMERLEGFDLRKLVRDEGALAPSRALVIARQIAKALAAAHARGIVHRDLKSENVFICPREGSDHIKLLDFGISKVTELDNDRGPLTSEGVVMGTPHYMAPELLHGAMSADQRADIYALGCVLFEMLTGALPFTGRTAMEVAYKHVHEPVDPPSRRRPGLAPSLDRIVLHALEKNPADRIADAEAFLSDLDALERAPASTLPPEPSITAPPVITPPSPPQAPPSRASRALLVGTVASLTVGLLLALRGPSSTASTTPARDAGSLAQREPTLDTMADVAVVAVPSTNAEDVAPALDDVPSTMADDVRDEPVSESAAFMDATVRRAERTNVGTIQPPRPSAPDATPAAVVDTGVAPLRPLLPDAAPRSPDDGLKQTPYGQRLAH